MGNFIDGRMQRAQREFDEMAEALKNDGLTIVASWNEDEPIGPFDGVLVQEDGRNIAKFKMNTGTGWHSTFHGWRVSLRSYEPRGRYNLLYATREPMDPNHWGSANLQSTAAALMKIIAAKGTGVTDAEIDVGLKKRKLDNIQYDIRTAREARKYALRGHEVQEEIVELLKDASMSDPLRKAMSKLDKAIAKEQDAVKRYNTLGDEIAKLEEHES